MKVQQTIKTETAKLAAGTAVLTAVMLAVFALLGKLDAAALIGAILGAVCAVLDFFLLGLTVQKAAEIQAAHPIRIPEGEEPQDEAAPADPETAKLIKKKVRISYYGRRLMLLAAAGLCLLTGINLLACVVPMLFPKLIIQARNLIQQLPKGVSGK